MLDTFVQCSNLKSFAHPSTRSGIFLETLRHSSGKSFDSRFFPFIQLLVNGLLDGLLCFNCSQFQMHSDPLKH